MTLYGIALDIRPTGGLTFRRMPSSILHISTYPFLPPTTMSGWLRRLLMLSAGHYPNTAAKDPPYFAMPSDYFVMGAYASPDPTGSFEIHTTHRQGVRAFNHNAFSRIVRSVDKKEVYQLHTWEYLVVEQLRGYILHNDSDALEKLHVAVNLGCKMGKEGFAYLEQMSAVRPLTRVRTSQLPSTLVGAAELVGHPSTIYALYRYEYKSRQPVIVDLTQDIRTDIEGFVPVMAGWPDSASEVELNYWADADNTWRIPASFVELMYGKHVRAD